MAVAARPLPVICTTSNGARPEWRALAGDRVSDNRVGRLCSTRRLWSVHSKKRGLNRKPARQGKRYLCAVQNVHSNKIVATESPQG